MSSKELTHDALPRASASLSVANISVEDLDFLEKDLLFFEKVSVCFLLCRTKPDFLFILEKLNIAFRVYREGVINKSPEKPFGTTIISTWARCDPEYKWREHLVEALAIVKSHKVLKKMGFNLEDLQLTYHARIDEFSVHVHSILKILHRMCEKMSMGESQRLILHMRSRFPVDCGDFGVDSERYLELYLLNWINRGVISIGEERKFDELLAFLKVNEMDEFWEKLNRFTTIASDANLEQIPTKMVMRSPEERNHSGYFQVDPLNMGHVLIINQKNFHKVKGKEIDYCFLEGNLETRHGTEKDVERLTETFTAFKFTVTEKKDLASGEILTTIDEYVRKTKDYHSCLVVVILSHGLEGTIYGSDSIPVEIRSVKEHMCVEKLKEKPKILIIQACQIREGVPEGKLASDAPQVTGMANLLTAWSTVEGYISFRHTTQGTWFIQTLCSKIEELHRREHFEDILVQVAAEVGAKEGDGGEKMVSKRDSTFKKKLYLPPLEL